MHSSQRHARKAFTLVELLVVIGIIAVLIGILIPALSKARQQSITVACLSNMRQIGQAAYNYASENHGYIVPGQYSQTSDNKTPAQYCSGSNETWCTILVNGGYLNAPDSAPNGDYASLGPQTNKNVFFCPAGLTDAISADISGSATIPYSRADAEGARGMRYFSWSWKNAVDCWYAMNGGNTSNNITDGGPPFRRVNPTTPDHWCQMVNVRKASATVAFYDGLFGLNFFKNPNRINARHNRETVTNLAFFDGHAESWKTADLPGGKFASDGLTIPQSNYSVFSNFKTLPAYLDTNYPPPNPLWLLAQQGE